jgi:hypothetical protein
MSGIKNRYFNNQHELLGDGKPEVLINQTRVSDWSKQMYLWFKPEV